MQAEEESKKDRFKRIAERRTNRVIDQLRLLGNLSNQSAYEYTDDDVNKIFSAIEQEVRSAKSKFAQERASKTKFKLS